MLDPSANMENNWDTPSFLVDTKMRDCPSGCHEGKPSKAGCEVSCCDSWDDGSMTQMLPPLEYAIGAASPSADEQARNRQSRAIEQRENSREGEDWADRMIRDRSRRNRHCLKSRCYLIERDGPMRSPC